VVAGALVVEVVVDEVDVVVVVGGPVGAMVAGVTTTAGAAATGMCREVRAMSSPPIGPSADPETGLSPELLPARLSAANREPRMAAELPAADCDDSS
jgi:hypothetical protein